MGLLVPLLFPLLLLPLCMGEASQRAKCALDCYHKCMQSGTPSAVYCNCPVNRDQKRCDGMHQRIVNASQTPVSSSVSSEYLDAHSIRLQLPPHPAAFVYVFEYAATYDPDEWYFAGASATPSLAFAISDACRAYLFRWIMLPRTGDPSPQLAVSAPAPIPVQLPPFTLDKEQIVVEQPAYVAESDSLRVLVRWTLPRGFAEADVLGYEHPALFPVQCLTPEDELPTPKVEIVRGGARMSVILPASILERRCRLWAEVRMLPRCHRVQPFLIQQTIELDCEHTPHLDVCKKETTPTCIDSIDVWGRNGQAVVRWQPPRGSAPLYYHVRYGVAAMQGAPPFETWRIVEKHDEELRGAITSLSLSLPENENYGVQVCAVYNQSRRRPKFGLVRVTPFRCQHCNTNSTNDISTSRCGECSKLDETTPGIKKDCVPGDNRCPIENKSPSQTVFRMETDLVVADDRRSETNISVVHLKPAKASEEGLPKRRTYGTSSHNQTHLPAADLNSLERLTLQTSTEESGEVSPDTEVEMETKTTTETTTTTTEQTTTIASTTEETSASTGFALEMPKEHTGMIISEEKKEEQTVEQAGKEQKEKEEKKEEEKEQQIDKVKEENKKEEETLQIEDITDSTLFPLFGSVNPKMHGEKIAVDVLASAPPLQEGEAESSELEELNQQLALAATTTAALQQTLDTIEAERSEVRLHPQKCGRLECEFGCDGRRCHCPSESHRSTPAGGCMRVYARCVPLADVEGDWDETSRTLKVLSAEARRHVLLSTYADKVLVELGIATSAGFPPRRASDCSTREGTLHRAIIGTQKVVSAGLFSEFGLQLHLNCSLAVVGDTAPVYGVRICAYNSSMIHDPLSRNWDVDESLNGTAASKVLRQSPIRFQSSHTLAGADMYRSVFFTSGKISILVILLLIMSILIYLNCTRLKVMWERRRTRYFRPFYVDPDIHVTAMNTTFDGTIDRMGRQSGHNHVTANQMGSALQAVAPQPLPLGYPHYYNSSNKRLSRMI